MNKSAVLLEPYKDLQTINNSDPIDLLGKVGSDII